MVLNSVKGADCRIVGGGGLTHRGEMALLPVQVARTVFGIRLAGRFL